MPEMSADRRVPTAADVGRWGGRWHLSSPKGHSWEATLSVYHGKVYVEDAFDEFGEGATLVDWFPGFTFRPVNPEPLPWPAEGDDSKANVDEK